MLGTVWFFIYLSSTFIPLDVDNFGDSFYLFLFVTGKKKSKLFLGVKRIKTSLKKQSRN